MKWVRRHRARLKAALRGWQNPVAQLAWPVQSSAEWSNTVNFQENQSVLRLLLVVDNEILSDAPRAHVVGLVEDEARRMVTRATREYLDARS